MEKLRPKKHCANAKDNTYSCNNTETADKNTDNPLALSCSEILAGEVYRCLIQRVHGCIYESLDILRSGIACHGYRSEGVHRGLYQHIGYREDSSGHTCRKAYPDYLHELLLRYPQP